MLCEGCYLRFNILRKKRQCCKCMRSFCGQCLVTQPRACSILLLREADRNFVCSSCMVLLSRPLCRYQVRQLNVADLQSYLRAQRISTEGCIEKDDLVNILLQHAMDSSSENERTGTSDVCDGRTDVACDDTHSHGVTSSISHPIISSELHECSVGAPNDTGQSQDDAIQERPDHGNSELEIVELTDWTSGATGFDMPDVEPIIEESNDEVQPSTSTATSEVPHAATVRRGRISIKDYGSLKELETLSVKQMKELLVLNRVDFRGCCEKWELMERITRLWVDHYHSQKDMENLNPSEMCKICMDARIECVMLDCGHMATCMDCGKQLNECPICRQYVVRVIRVFKV